MKIEVASKKFHYYTLLRYNTCFQLEKDCRQPKIHRLRIIYLFEADYNLFLKLIWGSRIIESFEGFNKTLQYNGCAFQEDPKL